MAGQTINDRLLAAKHSLAGQGLAKSVCKATTEELLGPKKKHLDYLIHCTNEPNVSIPQLANLLIERSQNTNWVVVFKALITVHHLMCYGNQRFTQYLASSNSTFQLSNFLDKSGAQAGARLGYEMSPFIRRYARYLNEKAISYRTVAFDFCKVKRGKEDGVLRTMNADKLLKTLPVLQSQLDALLEFDCTPNDLSNAVISMAFMLLFRDLIRLFAGYNDSIINLLEKYFDMNKKQCREALDLYKKFLIRMDRVGEFLKVAENVGIDKGEIPDLTKAPSSLLDALEQHLAALEGKKSIVNTPTQVATQQRSDVRTGVSALSSTSSSFGTAAQQSDIVDETVAKQALAEEEAILNQYKAKIQSPVNSCAPAPTNPFLNSPTAPIVDLFSVPASSTVAAKNINQSKASDDLLQLGNPFADMFSQPTSCVASTTTTVSSSAFTNNTANNNIWMTNGFSNNKSSLTNAFVDDRLFTSVFGDNSTVTSTTITTAASDGLISSSSNSIPDNIGTAGGATDDDSKISKLGNSTAAPPPRPPPPGGCGGGAAANKSAFDELNDCIRVAMGSPSRPPPPASLQQAIPAVPFGAQTMQSFPSQIPQQMYSSPSKCPIAPSGTTCTSNVAGSNKVLTGDLDSSLASLAENLNINKTNTQTKPIQWNSPAKGANSQTTWTPQPMAATTGVNYKPMVQGMPPSNAATTFPTAYSMGMQSIPAARMTIPSYCTTTVMSQPQQTIVPPQTQQSTTLDPFGAL